MQDETKLAEAKRIMVWHARFNKYCRISKVRLQAFAAFMCSRYINIRVLNNED